MIKKKFKLKGEDIKKFFTDSSYLKISSNNFYVLCKKNNLSYPRFAVTFKKNVFKKALERNKLKRRVYCIIEEYLKRSKISGLDFFIITLNKDSYLNLKRSLIEILNKCLNF